MPVQQNTVDQYQGQRRSVVMCVVTPQGGANLCFTPITAFSPSDYCIYRSQPQTHSFTEWLIMGDVLTYSLKDTCFQSYFHYAAKIKK